MSHAETNLDPLAPAVTLRGPATLKKIGLLAIRDRTKCAAGALPRPIPGACTAYAIARRGHPGAVLAARLELSAGCVAAFVGFYGRAPSTQMKQDANNARALSAGWPKALLVFLSISRISDLKRNARLSTGFRAAPLAVSRAAEPGRGPRRVTRGAGTARGMSSSRCAT
jgi:hypothetical protein